MSKSKYFLKYLKNINNSINNFLEKNLNKLNFKNLKYILKINKLILIFVIFFVLFATYLSVPTFYKQSNISKKLKNELKNKFDLDFKFSQNLKYNIFPRPHFTTNDSTIINGKSEISKVSKLKIFISLNNFFSVENIEVGDLILQNSNFNINTENYNFFIDLLNENFQNGNLIIKDSNIFFRNPEGEVLFINKILKLKYYFEIKKLKNIFYSENEIFNIPFSIESFFGEYKNSFFSNINFSSINFNIENELKLNQRNKTGKSIFEFNNLKKIAEYKIEKDFFTFRIFDKIDDPNLSYKGEFNLKPFYASLNGNLRNINLSHLFGSNAIIVGFLKTEIFNNQNIDFNLNINSKSIYGSDNFKNIKLKLKIKEGLIDIDKTKFEWKDFAEFELKESLIFVRNGELILDGKLNIIINDYNKIYKYLLTPKKYRNEIKQIDLNFSYNFDKKTIEIKDIKIDNKLNSNVNKILNNVILKEHKLQNRIYLENLLNDVFKSYAG